MDDWLDSWTTTRRFYSAAERRAADAATYAEVPDNTPAPPIPVEHSKYILAHGRKAYRKWLEDQQLVI